MRERCDNPKCRQFRWYGARGVSYDTAWKSFPAFLADMGERPIGKTLERIDRGKDYGKSNCKWATDEEQHLNKSNTIVVEYAGKCLSLSGWARELNLDPATLATRYRKEGLTDVGKLLRPKYARP